MTAELAGKLEQLKATVEKRREMDNHSVTMPPQLPDRAEQAEEAEARRLQRAREIALERKEVSAILNRWLNSAVASGKMSAQADCQRIIAFVNKLCASFEA